ncbi:hypothetical protein Glove_134g123 [Diversispora epigaea]|uniref:Uncharacterized protein n=1 Tax=Diversispora epigaea TaxID=1348612 RepID=A0A397IZH5_9GLOM|nr:hypothetical protein Glove_134g123 [Diversispora epigaea]
MGILKSLPSIKMLTKSGNLQAVLTRSRLPWIKRMKFVKNSQYNKNRRDNKQKRLWDLKRTSEEQWKEFEDSIEKYIELQTDEAKRKEYSIEIQWNYIKTGIIIHVPKIDFGFLSIGIISKGRKFLTKVKEPRNRMTLNWHKHPLYNTLKDLNKIGKLDEAKRKEYSIEIQWNYIKTGIIIHVPKIDFGFLRSQQNWKAGYISNFYITLYNVLWTERSYCVLERHLHTRT